MIKDDEMNQLHINYMKKFVPEEINKKNNKYFKKINMYDLFNKKNNNYNIKYIINKNIKLSNETYYKGNIKKFIYLISKKILNLHILHENIKNSNNMAILHETNLRIVSHGGIMRKFVKDIISNINNDDLTNEIKKDDFKKDLEENNLFNVFINFNLPTKKDDIEVKISLNRHAFSIANSIKMRGKAYTEQYRELDARLSIHGILSSLFFSNKLHVRETTEYKMNSKVNNVYVSILTRSWMTALCLYLQYSSNEFSLIISPYLKEKSGSLGIDSYGNTSEKDVNKQMLEMNRFIIFLRMIYNKYYKNIDCNTNENKENFCIKTNLEKIDLYFEKYKYITIYFSNKVYKIFATGIINVSNSSFSSTMKYADFNKNVPNITEQNINKSFIKEIKFYSGVKPLYKDFLIHRFTRWCEPFAYKKDKDNTYIKKICKKKLDANSKNSIFTKFTKLFY